MRSLREMETIVVTKIHGAGDRFSVEVYGTDGVPSEHEVVVADDDWGRFGGGYRTREELLEASFRFLLEREPKDSILRSFPLGAIERYFPEYGEAFTPRT
jgi:hypothetical protein